LPLRFFVNGCGVATLVVLTEQLETNYGIVSFVDMRIITIIIIVDQHQIKIIVDLKFYK
jgi:hypothetical protein